MIKLWDGGWTTTFLIWHITSPLNWEYCRRCPLTCELWICYEYHGFETFAWCFNTLWSAKNAIPCALQELAVFYWGSLESLRGMSYFCEDEAKFFHVRSHLSFSCSFPALICRFQGTAPHKCNVVSLHLDNHRWIFSLSFCLSLPRRFFENVKNLLTGTFSLFGLPFFCALRSWRCFHVWWCKAVFTKARNSLKSYDTM